MEPVAEQGNRDTGPLSLDQAAALVGRLRQSRDETTPDAGESAAPVDVPAEEAETSDAEADAVEAEPGEESGEDVDAESEAEQPVEEPRTYTVTVDGKELEVTLDELTRGYQRLSDYTRKTQQLAAQRQHVESLAASYQQAQQYISQRLADIEALVSEEPEPDWQKLSEDPFAFAKAQAEWMQRQKKQQALQAERYRLAQLQAAQEAEALRAHVESLRPRIPEVIPEWRDSKVAQNERRAIREFMTSELGLPQDFDFTELWQLKAARLAWLGHQALKAKSTMGQKLNAARPGPVMKSGAAPSRNTVAVKQNEVSAAMVQLRQTRDKDVAARLLGMLRKG